MASSAVNIRIYTASQTGTALPYEAPKTHTSEPSKIFLSLSPSRAFLV